MVWHSTFISMANSHQFYAAIDPTVTPDPNDINYQQQIEYAFTVLSRVLQSPRTSSLVLPYLETRDARAIYADFLECFDKDNPHTDNTLEKLEPALAKSSIDWLVPVL